MKNQPDSVAVHASFCLPLCPSVCLSACLSVCLSDLVKGRASLIHVETHGLFIDSLQYPGSLGYQRQQLTSLSSSLVLSHGRSTQHDERGAAPLRSLHGGHGWRGNKSRCRCIYFGFWLFLCCCEKATKTVSSEIDIQCSAIPSSNSTT